MTKSRRSVAYKIINTKKLKSKTSRSRVDNSLTKKYCPLFRSKCKGLNCVFGDKKEEYSCFSGDKSVLFCKLFEGLTGRLKFEIETSIKQEDD